MKKILTFIGQTDFLLKKKGNYLSSKSFYYIYETSWSNLDQIFCENMHHLRMEGAKQFRLINQRSKIK